MRADADLRPLGTARAAILDAVAELPPMRMALREARGLVLAEPVVARHDVPPFPNSAMDGYAVRASDVASPPTRLPVIDHVAAGDVARHAVAQGTAIKIMTGAPMPEGADAVVPVEETFEPEPGVLEIRRSVRPGDAVRAAGTDVVAGATVLEAGTRLTGPHLALLAAVGEAWPVVRRRPRVAIMSTGDEVVPPDTEVLAPGMIRDTNRTLLRSLLGEFGAIVIDHGIVSDDPEALGRVLHHASRNADVVVTSGGVSMGDHDVVKAVFGDGGDVEFWRIAMQPAKPLGFGRVGEVPFFGLPGNPVSVFVAFEQFLRPALLAMMGSDIVLRPRVAGVAGAAIGTNPAKTVFVRVKVDHQPGRGFVAAPSGGQSSHVLSALAGADAFAVVPVGTATVEPGEPVTLEMFRWPEARSRKEASDD